MRGFCIVRLFDEQRVLFVKDFPIGLTPPKIIKQHTMPVGILQTLRREGEGLRAWRSVVVISPKSYAQGLARMHAPRSCRMFTRGKESPRTREWNLLQSRCCVRSAPLTIIGRRLQGMPHFGGTQLNSLLAAFFHDKGRVGAAGAALSPSPASSWTSRSETPSLCRQFGIRERPAGP